MNGLDILMIGPFPTDEDRIEGGVQASLYGLCRTLVASGDVERIRVVATPNRVGGEVVWRNTAGVEVLHLNAPMRFMISSVLHVPTIVGMLARSTGSVVHLHGSGLFELAILVACRLKRLPVVWTLHGLTEKETFEAWRRRPSAAGYARHLLYKACERLQLRLAQTLIVDTPYVAREVAGRARAVPTALPQGIFGEELAPAHAEHRLAPIVLALGVIHPRKGHDKTIAAFARVLEHVPEARLEVIGSLTSVDHLAALGALVERLGITDRVSIRTDLARRDVIDALARARVFALHSEEESQGIALCEAMAVGLPVVATAVGGIPDVIGPGDAGVLVAHGDVDGFAAHITRLLVDDATHDRMSHAATLRGADFDWTRIAKGIVDLYRITALGRPNRREPRYPDVRPATPTDRSEPG